MTPEKNKQRSILRKPPGAKEPAQVDKPVFKVKRESVIQPVSSDMTAENVHAQPVKINISKIKLGDNSETTHVEPAQTATVVEQPDVMTSGDSSPVVRSDNSQPVNLVSLSASQIKNRRPKLPTGVYIIIAANFIGFTISFFDSSQNSLIYTYSILFSLLIAIGLLLRFDTIRKIYVAIAGLLVVLTIILMIAFFGLQERVDQDKANAASYYSGTSVDNLTLAQQRALANQESALKTLEKQEGSAVAFFYIYHSLIVVYAAVTVIYLTMPKVKWAFEPSSSP